MADDYDNMTVEELRAEIDSRGITGTSGMNKAQLIETLRADDAGELEDGEAGGDGEETTESEPGTPSNEHTPPPPGVDTVVTTDSQGNEFEVEAGVDGENPVAPNNPPPKALPEHMREEAWVPEEGGVEGETPGTDEEPA